MAAPRMPAATFRASDSAGDQPRSARQSSRPMYPHQRLPTKTGMATSEEDGSSVVSSMAEEYHQAAVGRKVSGPAGT
mgnify:CR=1 FL=1